MSENERITIYCDGGCIGGNPGKAVYWSVARMDRGGSDPDLYVERRRNDDFRTNNAAEWLALLEALTQIQTRELHGRIEILSDSKLIVNQYNGRNKVGENFQPFLIEAREKVAGIVNGNGTSLKVRWVPRAQIKAVLRH